MSIVLDLVIVVPSDLGKLIVRWDTWPLGAWQRVGSSIKKTMSDRLLTSPLNRERGKIDRQNKSFKIEESRQKTVDVKGTDDRREGINDSNHQFCDDQRSRQNRERLSDCQTEYRQFYIPSQSNDESSIENLGEDPHLQIVFLNCFPRAFKMWALRKASLMNFPQFFFGPFMSGNCPTY
jgi:hypothetical protein